MNDPAFNPPVAQGNAPAKVQTPLGEAEVVTSPGSAPGPASAPVVAAQSALPDANTYLGILQLINKPVQHVKAVPTNKPQNFAQQIVFYDDGAARRLYLYINNTWRYVALT